jgi:hypothetical protein
MRSRNLTAEGPAVFTSLVLTTLLPTPAAPIPKEPPPPIVVDAHHYTYPPRVFIGNGKVQVVNVDDGHFIQVTIRNNSTETLSFDSRHELGDLVYAKVTDEKGTEYSKFGNHLLLLCSSRSQAIELKPGESRTAIAHMLQDLELGRHGNMAPGKYAVRVVFQSGKVKAESAVTFPLEILK